MPLLNLRRALNTPPQETGDPPDGLKLAAELALGFRTLVAERITGGGGSDGAGATSEAELRRGACRLAAFDPRGLPATSARAFWINVYNALVRHGVIVFGVKRSMLAVPFFYTRASWHVGPFLLSLNDIEHGILRGNRRHPAQPWRPFSPGSQESALTLELDPRIHFALNCGGKSCPPIGVYRPESLDAQLDLATRSYLAQEIRVDPKRRTVFISKILRWYRGDFPGGPLQWSQSYLDDAPLARLREGLQRGYRVKTNPYDFELAPGE